MYDEWVSFFNLHKIKMRKRKTRLPIEGVISLLWNKTTILFFTSKKIPSNSIFKTSNFYHGSDLPWYVTVLKFICHLETLKWQRYFFLWFFDKWLSWNMGLAFSSQINDWKFNYDNFYVFVFFSPFAIFL